MLFLMVVPLTLTFIWLTNEMKLKYDHDYD